MVMERMTRSFGRMMHKGPGNNAKVSAMLKDFEDADRIMGQIIDGSNTLRDSWINLGTSQAGIAKEYQGLYDPIACASDPAGRPSQPTPELQLNRTFALQKVYAGLKEELIQEVVALDTQVVQPASDARKFLQPIRKTIKKREDKMIAYEKSQEKVKKLQTKNNMSAKDEAAMAKAENDMALASEEFQIADDHLAGTLPPLCEAVFSLIPCLLASIITVENRLLGVYYTVLHEFSQENQFASPPPPMSDVVAQWQADFQPIQRDIESMHILVNGKAVHLPMDAGTDAGASAAPRPSGLRRITTWNSSKDKSGQSTPQPADAPAPRPNRIASRTPSVAPSTASTDRSHELSRQSSRANMGLPTDFTTATQGAGASNTTPNYTPSRERSDYFGHDSQLERTSSNISTLSSQRNGGGSAVTTPYSASGAASPAVAAALASKKKPPPPPPPKKRGLGGPPPAEYVIALHTYPGGQAGDLSFNEGDQIRIVKKTDTMDDWWEGELRGVKGNFPANYCRMA